MRGSETVSDVREGYALSTQAVYRPIIWKARQAVVVVRLPLHGRVVENRDANALG